MYVLVTPTPRAFCVIHPAERQDLRSNSLYSVSAQSSVGVEKEPDLLLIDLRANSAFDDGFLLGPGNFTCLPATHQVPVVTS
jgi:hypothetical protein